MGFKSRHHKTYKTHLECEICGIIQSIRRRRNRKKCKGHYKHLWCPRCGIVTRHIELSEWDDDTINYSETTI